MRGKPRHVRAGDTHLQLRLDAIGERVNLHVLRLINDRAARGYVAAYWSSLPSVISACQELERRLEDHLTAEERFSLMCYVEGFSPREVALALGKPKRTVIRHFKPLLWKLEEVARNLYRPRRSAA